MAQAPIDYSKILFDATGKPYWLRGDGAKVFLPPLAAMQSNDPRAQAWAKSMGVYRDEAGTITNQSAPGANFAQERGHWNDETGQWDQNTDWTNIIGTSLAALPIGAGAASAFGGGGAPAAAGSQSGAGGTLASSTIPNAHLAVPTTAGMVSQGVSQTVPLGGMLPGVNGGGASGGGALDSLKNFFTNPADLAGLAGVIAGLAGGNGGGGGESEEAKRLHQITEARMRRVDPLHQAVTQLAWGRLPINSRNGIAAPVPSPLPESR